MWRSAAVVAAIFTVSSAWAEPYRPLPRLSPAKVRQRAASADGSSRAGRAASTTRQPDPGAAAVDAVATGSPDGELRVVRTSAAGAAPVPAADLRGRGEAPPEDVPAKVTAEPRLTENAALVTVAEERPTIIGSASGFPIVRERRDRGGRVVQVVRGPGAGDTFEIVRDAAGNLLSAGDRGLSRRW